MAKDNITQYIILGLLTHEPLTGYDIKKLIERQIGYFWSDLSFGQIYPILAKFEKEGLATKQVELHEDGPTRKVYTITDKGREAFRDWLRKPAAKEVIKYEMLLKLYFGSQLLLEENLKKLEEFRAQTIERIQLMTLYEENLRNVLEQNDDHLYFLLIVLFGKRWYQTQAEWIDEAMQMLTERGKP